MKLAQRSFGAGEVAPALYARTDVGFYGQALRTLRNAYVMRTGGIQSRPGTIYKGTTKSSGQARLIACVFADDQNYVLEFGNLYVRFWKDGSLVTATVTGAWADATSYTAGIVVSYSGTNYVCLQAHTSATATNRPSTGSSWTNFWAALSGTTYELPTPYTTAQLDALQVAQLPGQLIIAHPSHAPAGLTRIQNNVWDWAALTFNASSVVAAPSISGSYDAPLWFTSEAYVADDVVKNGGSVYRCILSHTSGASSEPGVGASWTTYWALKTVGTGGYQYVVTALTSTGQESVVSNTFVTDQTAGTAAFAYVALTWSAVSGASLYRVYRGLSALDYRPISESSGTSFTDADKTSGAYLAGGGPPVALSVFASSGNYPSAVAFHQQRLIFAGTTNQPDTVWASVTGEPLNFTVRSPIQDDDSIQWRQFANRATTMRHLLAVSNRLFGFTNVGEFVVSGADDGVLRPGEINPVVFSYNGAAAVAPLGMDDAAIYLQARGSRVLMLTQRERDGTMGSDLSLLSAHLVDGYSVTNWAFQEIPHQIAWMVRSDGTLLSMSYVPEAGITGWARHDTDGVFESVCSVPEGNEDAVYVIVRRTVNAATVRYVERLANRTASNPVLCDAAKTYTSPGTTTLTGLSHLEGKAVAVVADGVVKASPNNAAYTTLTVTSGQVVVAGIAAATNVQVGLPYTVDVETLDIDQGRGSVKNDNIRVGQVFIWIENSGSFYVAPKAVTGTSLATFEQYTPMNDEEYPLAAGQTFTGVAPLVLQSTYTKNGRIFIRQPDAVPLTILAVVPEGLINGRG